jgi:hypothetical protein
MCETAEFWNVTTPIARRAYYCEECAQPIERGTKYVRMSGKWDGQVGTIKSCESCYAFMHLCYKEGAYENECGGITYGGDFREFSSEYAEDILAAIPAEKIPAYWLEYLKKCADRYRAKYWRGA